MAVRNPHKHRRLSNPKHSNRHAILLFQIFHIQAYGLPCPTISRPTALGVVSRDTAIAIAGQEV